MGNKTQNEIENKMMFFVIQKSVLKKLLNANNLMQF